MLNRFFITTFRYLWRHRLFTALNIIGLAVSISACWIIYSIINYDYSFERGIPGKNNIYRLVTGFVFDDKEQYNGGVSKPVYQGIREQVSGVEKAIPVFGLYLKSVEVNTATGKPLVFEEQTGVVSTDSTYFQMLPYRWKAGNPSTAFVHPETVVLTEKRAKEYFPGKTPDEMLNQTITYYSYRDTIQRTVSGIVTPAFSGPTEFTEQEFCSLPVKAYELMHWSNTNGSDKLYLQLKKGAAPAKIVSLIDTLAAQKMAAFQQQRHDDYKFKRWYELMPLRESHFSTYIDEWSDGGPLRKANKSILFGLAGIAAFLLLLACINYINMGVASIPRRTKEIGVRKTLGSSRKQLIGQFLMETLIVTFLAGLCSLLLSKVGFWLLRDIIPQGVAPFANVLLLAGFIIIVALVVTFLAGLYPAWLITKVNAVNVFRNTGFTRGNNKGFSLQKVLIVFQFFIALVFISGAIIVAKQLNYALKADMGFNKEAVILATVPWKYNSDKQYKDRQFSLLTELRRIPGIRSASLGTEPMSSGYSSSQYEYTEEGKEPIKRQVYKKWVDTAYLNLYGMKLLAGRNLHASDTTNEFVINETAMHAFGFTSPAAALGKYIGQPGQKFPVVGVVKDFHLQNFYTTIDPMAFESERSNLYSFNIKLGKDPTQWDKTVKAIGKKWYEFYPPESFTYKFYDETIEEMYAKEQHLARLVDIATAISIVISCLGLFGLAVLTAFQRTKEIGIRKVLGSSVAGIVRLLSKEYIILVIIAIVIAIPVAWWAMDIWLQKFAYRISIQWWMFLLAGMIAVSLALITVGFHAVRAAVANPVKSLRTE